MSRILLCKMVGNWSNKGCKYECWVSGGSGEVWKLVRSEVVVSSSVRVVSRYCFVWVEVCKRGPRGRKRLLWMILVRVLCCGGHRVAVGGGWRVGVV